MHSPVHDPVHNPLHDPGGRAQPTGGSRRGVGGMRTIAGALSSAQIATMTSVASPPAVTNGRHTTEKRRHPVRWTLLGLLLLVVAALVVFGVWLANGLKTAASDVKTHANETQDSLQLFKTALQAGDQAGAERDLTAARRSLDQADAAAARRQVRVASHLPVASTAVSDLDHLLSAADLVVQAGGRAQKIYGDFSGKDSKLFNDNQFDLGALSSATASAKAIDAMMAKAETDLDAVKGTVRGTEQVKVARDSALVQVKDLRAQIAALVPILDVLPNAVGADGSKRYLVALLNPGEMRGSGGAPLSVITVQFVKGKMTFVQKGATAQLTMKDGTENGVFGWNWTPSNPYHALQRFANANLNPNYPVSGEEMVRAWKASTRTNLNGVIALDAVAIRDALTITGPIQSTKYGPVSADNLVQKVLIDSYTEYETDPGGRRDLNEELIDKLLPQLTQGGGIIGKAKAIAAAVPGRHLQLYFRDPALQQLVVDKGLSGQMAVQPAGDYLAAYTQNSNGSKVDVFQQRRLAVRATLAADGSATVTQTMTIRNAAPKIKNRTKADEKKGYGTRYAGEEIQLYRPATATAVSVSGDGKAKGDGRDAQGRVFARRTGILLKAGASATVTMRYRLAAGTFGSGASLAYRLTAEPSNLLNTPSVSLSVTAPDGWTVTPQPGWTAQGRTATVTLPLDQLRTLAVPLTH